MSQEQQVNNDFDVDEYEPEEYSYQQVSLTRTVSVVVKPEKPFYIPLTDVTYPGEKDSTYDLKKLVEVLLSNVNHSSKTHLPSKLLGRPLKERTL